MEGKEGIEHSVILRLVSRGYLANDVMKLLWARKSAHYDGGSGALLSFSFFFFFCCAVFASLSLISCDRLSVRDTLTGKLVTCAHAAARLESEFYSRVSTFTCHAARTALKVHRNTFFNFFEI